MAPGVCSTEQLVARIIAQPGPVVFLDSCAVLDVLRAIHRTDTEPAVVHAVVKLLQPTTQADRIWLTTTELVLEEIGVNREAVVHELGAKLVAIENQIARLTTVAGCLVSGHPDPAALPDDLRDRIVSLTDRLILACSIFSGSEICRLKAMNRVIHRSHPSPKPGKPQPKDCIIFEEFLELARQLRGGGRFEAMCFVTSNKGDYGDPEEGPIATELAPLGARYVSNIAWAYSLLNPRAQSAP